MRLTSLLAFALTSTLATAALAQEGDASAEGSAEGSASVSMDGAAAGPSVGMLTGFGRAGVFVIGAERLMGFSQTSNKIKIDDPAVSSEEDSSQTSFFFLGSNPQGNQTNPLGSPFIAPRIGFDYFIVDNVSVGGAITYVSDTSSGDRTQGNQQQDLEDISTNTFMVSPRAGYALMFSETFGLWPRGGISYVNMKSEVGDNETSATILALSLEGNLVITPVPHAGFLIGPTLDFPLVGSGELKQPNATTDLDTFKVTTFGLQAGLFVWL
ncbi:MAG: hypothetical protein R3B13_22875 [Polyangiaceae bacterium]